MQIYLEVDHLGGALGENNPGQQEEKGVSNKAVHRFPIQEQAWVDSLNQVLWLPVKEISIIGTYEYIWSMHENVVCCHVFK